ncbi:MAG: SDR family oxidoreductase [Rhizobiales bacterium]|nr:SDR family oxidoreductase [Hyphomicrobiales bacterium]
MASVLFIGGTGQISLACVEEAVRAGHKVSVFNRGRTAAELPAGVTSIIGDMANAADYARLAAKNFDVVCQFMAFTPEQMAADIAAFAGHAGQYVFISTASAYQKPPRHYVITEKTPVENPFWDYSQKKIAAEHLLRGQSRLPWTIVRPSHTVRTKLATSLGEGDLVPERMRAGKAIIVAGDGTQLWTVTRSRDLAVPFVRLFGNAQALGEDFHITTDRGHSWNDINRAIAAKLGVEARLCHVPTDTLVRFKPDWLGPLVGDKMGSTLFDNAKIKSVVGDFACATSLDEILAEPFVHYEARRKAGTLVVDAALDALEDRIAAAQDAVGP